ncbi:MAG: tRNA guanosine(34) transglycosylase Tgt [Phycisphaerales bacterium]|nr:tRNA guanosine(34) transglycosylase Tgt [Phycisphaerales bacterium]
MTAPLTFDIDHACQSTHARAGRITTLHGSFETPVFMPVATAAAMKGVSVEQIESTSSRMILNNAYHLMLRPTAERIAQFGGSHEFMRWPHSMLTDSGGFQAWSMSDIVTLTEEGVRFRSFIDGSSIMLTPERSIEVQNLIGADIIMAFDDCPPSVSKTSESDVDEEGGATSSDEGGSTRPSKKATLSPEAHARRLIEAVERTARWLERCKAAHQRPTEQSLFGIVQGGTDLALRARSAALTTAIDLPGYAIGGVAVGEGTDDIRRVVEFTAPLLPRDRPRYLMGVGYERDIVAAVRAGVDMFDCVLPTRNGRKGYAFTRSGPVRLRNACHTLEKAPLDPSCDCLCCAGGYSRGYLRHLFMAGESLGGTLVSVHNIRHFQRLMVDIRVAIREDAWSTFEGQWPVLQAV